jgi:hypothetical protein
MENFKEKLLKNLDRVLFGSLAGVLACIGLIWLFEQNAAAPGTPEPDRKPIEAAIRQNDPAYLYVKFMSETPKRIEETDYAELLNFNMFDAQAVRNAEKLIDSANAAFRQAAEAFAAGDYEQARRFVLTAKSFRADFAPADELLAEIEKILEQAAAAEATPAPTPPGS